MIFFNRINGHQTVLQSPQKRPQIDWRVGIKDEPKESINSRSNEESVIVLNNNSSLKQSYTLPKTTYISQCTQTELCTSDIPQATAEIAHIQLDDRFDDSLKIKEESDFEEYVDNFADHVDQYSSDDNLTLNKMITASPLKIKIKKESIDDAVYKKKKAKKKKKENKRERKENIEGIVERKKRGRPKGSTNKLIKKAVKVVDGLIKLEGEEKSLKLEYDADKRFYPEGTAEEAKKWQCLTCFLYQNSRTDLLQHYKDHVR